MIETHPGHVLIAGVTSRAIAVSAARAGYRVTAVDAFGDLDLRAVAEVITLGSTPGARFDPLAAAIAGERVPAGLAAYTSNLENHPKAVERLARGRRLLGNPPAVLIQVRNPVVLSSLLRRRGFATPATRATPPINPGVARWLLKPRKSGGGHRVEPWRHERSVPRSSYLQERIAGIPGSVIFAANGDGAVVLGLSRQLVGDSRFGAQGFRYCGSLIGSHSAPVFPRQGEILQTAAALAVEVTREFGLVGLNGIDFIARKGVPYPIEVNPRYSASMELLERIHGLSLFEIHVRACRGTLPSELEIHPGIEGKAIVFARRDVILGNTGAWIGRQSLADVPHPGERIPYGRPICTVFARGSNQATCLRRLVREARVVYRRVRTHARQAA
jgi:predicted ATP-grasp superfamily ATP-dependent carboligase